jgi:hypothetical protein
MAIKQVNFWLILRWLTTQQSVRYCGVLALCVSRYRFDWTCCTNNFQDMPESELSVAPELSREFFR